jgi:RHS repeat-associated protein
MFHYIPQPTTATLEYSYDAYGNPRNPANWEYGGSTAFGRGFTGTRSVRPCLWEWSEPETAGRTNPDECNDIGKYLEDFHGLINMNGRLYDPQVGRFLSPDNYVQSPDFTQSFNRYSYCLNNPLRYTDPSGDFIFTALLPGAGVIIDAMCWGAVINGGMYAASTVISSQQWDWGKFGKSLAVGAISGAAGAGAGMLTESLQVFGAVPGALIEGTIQGTAGGLAGGFGNVIMEDNWGAFGKGFAQGFTTGFILGGISGGIEGYKNSQSVGANVWSGKLYSNQKTYSATPKSGVTLQPNPERDCYGYALEYADIGHGNNQASYFLGKAGNVPGADAGQVARASNLPVNWSRRISGAQWDNVVGSLQMGKEILGTTSRDGVNHWVNLTKITTADKWRIVGGGWSRVLQSTSVWDPITGHVVNGPTNFFSIISLF